MSGRGSGYMNIAADEMIVRHRFCVFFKEK